MAGNKPHPRFDEARIKASAGKTDELSPASRLELVQAIRRQKITELRTAVKRFGIEDLAEEDADFILSRLLEPTSAHYQELTGRFPQLETYFKLLFKQRGK